MNFLKEYVEVTNELAKQYTGKKIDKEEYDSKRKLALIDLCKKSGMTWDEKLSECRNYGLTVFKVK